VFRSKEGAEDRDQDAVRVIKKHVRRRDAVVGIAASGVTAFVRGALIQAKKQKASTILVTCHAGVPKSSADVVIAVKTGPEVIAGSTRLKAGTATKLVLNSLTVASMIQLGKVYGNRMVDLQPRSRKLVARGTNLISKLGRVSEKRAARLFALSGGHAKTAIVMARKNVSKSDALRLLKKADGHLYRVIGRE
jgi:N-acetylmuramic acid 6-phosphate etherase